MNICLESCNLCPQAMRLFNETYGKKTERGEEETLTKLSLYQHTSTQAYTGTLRHRVI